MSIFQTTLLGIVQGLTEFLPVSSSGHLILFPAIVGWQIQSLAFDTVLHLGTAVALIIYFYRDLLSVIKSKKLLKLLLIGSIPAGTVGFFLEDIIETVFRSSTSVAIFLLFGTAIMLIAEVSFKKEINENRISDINEISIKKGFLIGMFQSLALLSGVSRSGATISGGILLGLKRETAARFSFLLSLPIVLGAGLYKVLKSYSIIELDITLLGGFLSSALVGIIAINFLLKFLKKNTLYPFIIYRVILAILVVTFL